MLMIMSALTLSSCSKDDSKELEPETDIVGVWRCDSDEVYAYKLRTFEDNGKFTDEEFDYSADNYYWSISGRYFIKDNILCLIDSDGDSFEYIIHSITRDQLILSENNPQYYEDKEIWYRVK